MRANDRGTRRAALSMALLAAGLATLTSPLAARADDGASGGTGSGTVARARDGTRGDRWQGSLGVRGTFVRDTAFDPFSTSDALAQTSFAILHTLRAGQGFVPALGLAFDLGGSDASARGVDAQLDLWRLALVIEPRFVPTPGVYVGARLAPGLLHAAAALRDASAPAMLTTSYWTSSFDASLSTGVRVNPWTAPLGLWVVGDGGYSWTPRHELTLAPALGASDAAKAGATPLGSLAPRGLFLRVSLALSY